MIQKFVDRFMERKDLLAEQFKKEFPSNYMDVVKGVMEILADEDDCWDSPDPSRIVKVGWGSCQGENLYVIGASGYSPDTYWVVKVAYGSCSGCDTLARIESESGYDLDSRTSTITEQNIKDLLTLALHIVQNIKEV